MKKNVSKPLARLLSKIFLTDVLALFFIFTANIYAGEDVKKAKSSSEVTFKIIGSEPQPGLCKTYRRMLVGPWVHQPEEYQGYNGFVAWPGVTRLKSGRWLLTFSSGYWHASPPLTKEILKDPKCRERFDTLKKSGVFRSSDRGKMFELASIVGADHELNEPTIAELADGRLVMIMRPKGDICWSDDGGRTWTDPVSIGVDLFDPHLIMMPNGVLACFHGSYPDLDLRVILSSDNGCTWHGPGEDIGYSVDPSVYGYSHPMLLPDGTVYLVYIHTGGHKPADARTQAIWALRIRINDNADGIEILHSIKS